jgi:hypothetical protein
MRTSSVTALEPPAQDAASPQRALCQTGFTASLRAALEEDSPYHHWILAQALPSAIVQALDALPFPAPAVGSESGSRELHNNTRRYFDPQAIATYAICRDVAEAFQADETVALVEAVTGAALSGCHLRIEFAQDTDGFWLTPHTDLGVKKFTLLCYLGPEGRPELGTDIYSNAATWSHRTPFLPGAAMAFVPSDRTWHGFEPRPIQGVRKSLIVNYVSDEWRAREQLAYPDAPVRSR